MKITVFTYISHKSKPNIGRYYPYIEHMSMILLVEVERMMVIGEITWWTLQGLRYQLTWGGWKVLVEFDDRFRQDGDSCEYVYWEKDLSYQNSQAWKHEHHLRRKNKCAMNGLICNFQSEKAIKIHMFFSYFLLGNKLRCFSKSKFG